MSRQRTHALVCHGGTVMSKKVEVLVSANLGENVSSEGTADARANLVLLKGLLNLLEVGEEAN